MTNFSSKIISPSLPRGECNIHLIRKVRTKEVNTIFFQSFYFWSLITFNLNSDKIINYQWIFTSTTFLNCVCSNQMFWYSFIIFQNKKCCLLSCIFQILSSLGWPKCTDCTDFLFFPKNIYGIYGLSLKLYGFLGFFARKTLFFSILT